MRNKILQIAVLMFILAGVVYGQSTMSSASEEPKWVIMMQDPQANYYETIAEFRKFWEGKALPEEPFEDKEMDVFEREVGLIKTERDHELREALEKVQRDIKKTLDINGRHYAAEVRAFKGWMQQVKPWVQSDGQIIGLDEQQKIIERQQQELKSIEQQSKR